MQRILQDLPGNAARRIPLVVIANVATHEQQFLARMRIHEGEERAHIGELLPIVARHFRDQRPFAINHLVMRDRQDEVFAEGIDQAKCDLVLVVFAIKRIHAEIVQHVVHPAHIPLHGEAKPVRINRPRHSRE